MCAVVNASQRKSSRIQLVNSVDLDRVVAWLLKHVCVLWSLQEVEVLRMEPINLSESAGFSLEIRKKEFLSRLL